MFELFTQLKKHKVIGFTCGTFDLLHPGHIMMFEESKAHCDYLIVGLLSDPTISRPEIKNKPVQSMWERFVNLQAVKVIDFIVPWDTEDDLIQMLEMIKPNKRFVGEEYKNKEFTAKHLCNTIGIEIIYNRRTHKYGSSELRSRESIHIPKETLPIGIYKPCPSCRGECISIDDCVEIQKPLNDGWCHDKTQESV